MALKAVTAITPMTYRGRAMVPGESFHVNALEAMVFRRLGKVRDADAPAPEPEKPIRRTYRRRDLKAEP